MKTFCFLVLASMISMVVFCQKPKSEIIERKGQVIEIAPGFTFAFSKLIVKTEDDTLYLRFNPQKGELITSHVKKGDGIELRAKVINWRNMINRQRMFNFMDGDLLAVNFNGSWVEIDMTDLETPRSECKVFLEKKVKGEFFINGSRSALLYDNDFVALNMFNTNFHYPMKDVRVGQTVSFIGYKNVRRKGYTYPVWNPKEVYSFVRLYKAEGEVSAYLYKQNNVCIGLTLKANGDNIKVSFPSDMGKQIKQFVDAHPFVTAYYNDYKVEDQLSPPELHALIDNRDSLFINRMGFYGGTDVNHDHKPVEIEGKISAVNRSAKGKIMSVILDNDYYIEVDHTMEKQLSSYLKRGNIIKVNGQERIKKEGEIYSRDYRIITPSQVATDGKVFLINMIP